MPTLPDGHSEPVVHFCDAQNVNYGETCSHKATFVYEKGDIRRFFCTRHAPKRNRYCKPIGAADA